MLLCFGARNIVEKPSPPRDARWSVIGSDGKTPGIQAIGLKQAQKFDFPPRALFLASSLRSERFAFSGEQVRARFGFESLELQ
jgi:hypothetical protein